MKKAYHKEVYIDTDWHAGKTLIHNLTGIDLIFEKSDVVDIIHNVILHIPQCII